MKNNELKQKVIANVETNRIWLNALHCINPSDEFKIRLANTILNMLNNEENLLPLYLDDSDEEIGKMQKLIPVLYLSINKS